MDAIVTQSKMGRAGLRALKTLFRFDGNVQEMARALLRRLVAEHAEEMVEAFYEGFLKDEEAAPFLTPEAVHDRLAHSLVRWLHELVDSDLESDPEVFDAHQRKVGEIHARIKLPIHLVLDGVNLLKGQLIHHVTHEDCEPEVALSAVVILGHLVDYAMYRMSEAYVGGIKRGVKMDEAYRLFALGQDASIERESQRAALMEWSQSIFLAMLGGSGNEGSLPAIADSNFGLWMHHRGSMVFAGMPSLGSIEAMMQQIDGELLPRIAALRDGSKEDLGARLAELQALVEKIKYHFVGLFQNSAHLVGGRDPLTQMLNRRFMPTILSQEVQLAAERRKPFSLVMIDIDRFKAINDEKGHPAGDVVIREVADVVVHNVRGSDFAFRYGGEEFLLALVETDVVAAKLIAERIRAEVAGLAIRLPDGDTAEATVSIGVASFQGHPDHEFLLRRVDRALYRAKQNGRDRIECHDAAHEADIDDDG